MAIKLDIQGKLNEDKKAAPSTPKETKAEIKPIRSKQDSVSAKKKGQGRPKGAPAVTRSLRIRADINERLVQEHERTRLSYNELVNMALDTYLNNIK
jgi:hypothetical protein